MRAAILLCPGDLHREEGLNDIDVGCSVPRDLGRPENPALGQVRVSQEMLQRGIIVSPGGVRSIWLRHELETMAKRLKALEARSAQEGTVLTEAQIVALEKAKSKRESAGEIETHHPGYLGSQDTYYVGTMKGVGRVYQQTFVDTYSRVALAKLYIEKTAIPAADMLNDQVIPFFDANDVSLLRILTDRGTEYCGKVENHPYQLYLAMEDVDHSRTKSTFQILMVEFSDGNNGREISLTSLD